METPVGSNPGWKQPKEGVPKAKVLWRFKLKANASKTVPRCV